MMVMLTFRSLMGEEVVPAPFALTWKIEGTWVL